MNKNPLTEKAITFVQNHYCTRERGTPFLLLGDVASLIELLTGDKVDWNELDKHRKPIEKSDLPKWMTEKWEDISDENTCAYLVEKTRHLTPISANSSTHIHEEIYVIDGDIYRFLMGSGVELKDANIEKFIK